MKRLRLLTIACLVLAACEQPPPEPVAPATLPAAEPAPKAAPAPAPKPSPKPAPAADPVGDAPEAWQKTIERGPGDDLRVLFDAELAAARAAGDQIVIVFTADWCSPCRTIKDFLDESGSVRRAVVGGRFLYIDVDDWRGPAHGLIEGANPRKLPMLVRVDHDGRLVQLAMGSEVGLLSSQAAAVNLGRLVAGQAPTPHEWEEDPSKKTALLKAQNERNKARLAGLEPAEVEVLARPESGRGTWRLKLTLRTMDARMRWFVLPTKLDAQLVDEPEVTGYEVHKLDEHVRYAFVRYRAAADFDVVAVGRHGLLVLDGWEIEGPADAVALELWELNQLKNNGEVTQFDKKVPYELFVERPTATRIFRKSAEAVDVELVVRKRHTLTLN